MAEEDTWCTIESDPGVFTELIEEIGVKNVQVEELCVLEDDVFEELKPIYGLVFLFKWESSKDDRPIVEAPDVFFAKQVIPNACATQAILSILLNASGLELGTTLEEFKGITKDWPPEVKGIAIGNEQTIRRVHNSFARQESFAIEKDPTMEAEDAFHFISYVPVNGVLYELDGLKRGPIALSPCTDDNWLKLVKPVITKRIEAYSKSEIRFNLMAIIKNRKQTLLHELAQLKEKKSNEMQTDDSSSISAVTDERIEQIQLLIHKEEAKFANWKAENQRRKHNYIPFLFNLLKVLAEKDMLIPLIEKAKHKKQQTQNQTEKK